MYAKLFEWRETTTTTPRRYTRCCCCCCCCCKNLLFSVVTSPSSCSNLHVSAASSSLSRSSHTNSSASSFRSFDGGGQVDVFGRAWERHNLDVSRDVSKRRRPFVQEHRKPTFNWMPECLFTRHASTPHVAGDVTVHEVRVRPARFDLRLNIDPRLVVVFFRRRGPSEVQQMTLNDHRISHRRVLLPLVTRLATRCAMTIVVSTPLMLSREEKKDDDDDDAPFLFHSSRWWCSNTSTIERRDNRIVLVLCFRCNK